MLSGKGSSTSGALPGHGATGTWPKIFPGLAAACVYFLLRCLTHWTTPGGRSKRSAKMMAYWSPLAVVPLQALSAALARSGVWHGTGRFRSSLAVRLLYMRSEPYSKI
jgi:hypothetical protein